MQAKKHTSGDWKAEFIGVSDSGPDGVEIYEVIAGGHVRVCEAVFKGDAVLIAAAPKLLAACIAQHHALDTLMARLIALDPEFRPTQSLTWAAVVQGNAAIASATAS